MNDLLFVLIQITEYFRQKEKGDMKDRDLSRHVKRGAEQEQWQAHNKTQHYIEPSTFKM